MKLSKKLQNLSSKFIEFFLKHLIIFYHRSLNLNVKNPQPVLDLMSNHDNIGLQTLDHEALKYNSEDFFWRENFLFHYCRPFLWIYSN